MSLIKQLIGYRLTKPYPGVSQVQIASKEKIDSTKDVFVVVGDTGRTFKRLQEYFINDYWKPVYEEQQEKIFLLDYTTATNRRTSLKIVIKDGKAYYGDWEFTAEVLEHLIIPTYLPSTGKKKETVPFVSTVFNFGCMEQYRYVARESIQELIKVMRGEDKKKPSSKK